MLKFKTWVDHSRIYLSTHESLHRWVPSTWSLIVCNLTTSLSGPASCSNFCQNNFLCRIRVDEIAIRHLLVPLHHTSRHANIVVQKKSCEDHLDLIGGEKASWTRMSPVTEYHVVFIGGDELRARLRAWRTSIFALSVMPKPIELRRIAVRTLFVVVDCE